MFWGEFFKSSFAQIELVSVCFLQQDIVIQQDDEIRLKIVGTRVDKNDIVNPWHFVEYAK